jgi:hypothetical protein
MRAYVALAGENEGVATGLQKQEIEEQKVEQKKHRDALGFGLKWVQSLSTCVRARRKNGGRSSKCAKRPLASWSPPGNFRKQPAFFFDSLFAAAIFEKSGSSSVRWSCAKNMARRAARQDVDPVLQGLAQLVGEPVEEPAEAPLPYRANKTIAFRKPAKTAYSHTPSSELLAGEHAIWMKNSEKRKNLREMQNQKRRQYVEDTKSEITGDKFMKGVRSDVTDRSVAKDLRYAMRMGQIPEWRQEVSNYRVSTPPALRMHDPPAKEAPKPEIVEEQVSVINISLCSPLILSLLVMRCF